MLDFINNNGILFSVVSTVISAIITAAATIMVAAIKEKSNVKMATEKMLREELNNTKERLVTLQKAFNEKKRQLEELQNNQSSEKSINKTHGQIYYDTTSDTQMRPICGFCWELNHVKIPLVVYMHYDEYAKDSYYCGRCKVCGNECIEKIDWCGSEDIEF